MFKTYLSNISIFSQIDFCDGIVAWHDADARPMIYKTENERGKRVKGGRSYFASYCSNAVCCIMAASSQLQKRAEFLALLPVVVACLYNRGKACKG